MTTIEVLMEIPPHILKGLTNGEYVREAAGVIRWASGPNKGRIVAHLRELGEGGPEMLRAGMGGPGTAFGAATVGLQVVTLAYLKVRFDRMEGLLHRTLHGLDDALHELRTVRELQALGFMRELVRAHELLLRYRTSRDRRQAEEALRALERGVADVGLWVSAFDGQGLIAEGPTGERLLTALAASASAELATLAELNAALPTYEAALQAHRRVWDLVAAKLREVRPATVRIPSAQVIRAWPNRRLGAVRRAWSADAKAMVDRLSADGDLLRRLGPVGVDELRALADGGGGSDVLCVVVERDAEADRPRRRRAVSTG